MNEIDDVKLNGHKFKRLPGNANFSFKNINAAKLVEDMGNEGICISAGSACAAAGRKTVAGYYGYKCSERVCLWNSKNNYIT